MRIALLCPLLLAIVGCADTHDTPAGAPVAAAAASAPASGVQVAAAQVCHHVIPTGSNIPVTRCETPSTDADRMDTHDGISRLLGSGTSAAGHGFSTGH